MEGQSKVMEGQMPPLAPPGYASEWANAWLISFNPTTCENIYMSNKKSPIVGNYYFQNHPIKVVTHAKYLGVTIDKHLSFNEHIYRISYKANSINAFFTEKHQVLSTKS